MAAVRRKANARKCWWHQLTASIASGRALVGSHRCSAQAVASNVEPVERLEMLVSQESSWDSEGKKGRSARRRRE